MLALADPRSESGTESILRVHLALAGVIARAQVPIPFAPLERFDLVIGDRLVIECESAEFHGGEEQRLRDLRRDAQAVGYGFIVLHYDYAQVMFDIETVLAGILVYVDQGLHLSSRARHSGRTS